MRLYVKEKIFKWSGVYSIYDESNEVKYVAKGLSESDKKITIYDKDGNECANMYSKLFGIIPRIHLNIDNKEIGIITKKVSVIRPRYDVSNINWYVEGDYRTWSYTMMDDNKEIVVSLCKTPINEYDVHEINVREEKDIFKAIMITLAIDIDHNPAYNHKTISNVNNLSDL